MSPAKRTEGPLSAANANRNQRVDHSLARRPHPRDISQREGSWKRSEKAAHPPLEVDDVPITHRRYDPDGGHCHQQENHQPIDPFQVKGSRALYPQAGERLAPNIPLKKPQKRNADEEISIGIEPQE